MVTITAHAATVPAGFLDVIFASGLTNPTAMEFAPDGRLFVAEQGGKLRVIENGVLRPTPFLSVGTDTSGERGLLGVAFDPNFASNHFVYIYYTATQPAVHNRVSRFTAAGDTVIPGSELVLVNLESLNATTNHNGGAIHFGRTVSSTLPSAKTPWRQTPRLSATVWERYCGSTPMARSPPDNPFS